MKLSEMLLSYGLMLGFLAVIFATAGAFCWPYTIITAAALCGKTVVVTWWQGALLGLIPGVGQLSLIAAGLVWVINLIFG